MTYQSLGIVLKKTDRGEADQVFSIYTQTKGKILALGRATKKPSSKLNSHLQQFAIIHLMIAPGKNSDHIASASLVKKYPDIQKDLKKIILGSFALELVEKLTKPGHSDEKIFLLLLRYLAALNDNFFSDSDWQIIKQTFTVKLLSILGFAPPADIASSSKKLNQFLQDHLNSELQTEKFLIKFIA